MSDYHNSSTKHDGRQLRRNRSDGRLKTYKSSDDCRAWNSNKRERHDYISEYIASSYDRCQGDTSEWGRYVPVPVLVDVVVQSYKDELQKLHAKLQKVQQELFDCEDGKNVFIGEKRVESEDVDIQVEEAVEEQAIFIREGADHEVQSGNIYRQDKGAFTSEAADREQMGEDGLEGDKDEGENTKGDKHAIMEEEYEMEREKRAQLKNSMDSTDSNSRTQNIRETLAEINTDFDKLMYLKDKEIQSLLSMQDSIPHRVSNEEWETSLQDEYPDFYENLKNYENDVEKKEREVKDLLQSIETQVLEEENKRNSRIFKDDESRTNTFNSRDHENMEGSGIYDGKHSQNEEFAKLKGELDILSVRLSALESSGERGDVEKYDKQREEVHLNEIQELQDSLTMCKKELKNERIEKEEVEIQLEKCIEEMFRSKNMADEKDRELSYLRDKLNRCKEEKEELELKLDTLSTSRRRSSKQLEKSEELISDLESQHAREVKSFNDKILQMKKQLKETEEEKDELQDKYQRLLEQCDNLKGRLKEFDALLEESTKAKQLANEFMGKLRVCEEENTILKERLEKLEDQRTSRNGNEKDLISESENEKIKALNNELQNQNESLKSDLENALTQLKHKTGSIDTLNKTLNIMKERLEDRDKELVEMKETNEELLAEYLQLKQRNDEEDLGEDKKLSELDDMLIKCSEEKRNLEVELEKSEKEIIEQKENYQKLLEESQKQLKYAEENLKKKDQELSELERNLMNCDDDRKVLESELAGMKTTYENVLKEFQTLKMDQEKEAIKLKEDNQLQETLKNCEEEKKILEGSLGEMENKLDKLNKSYQDLLDEHQSLKLELEDYQESQTNEALQQQNLLLKEQMLQDCENEKKNLKDEIENLETQLNLAKQNVIESKEEATERKEKGYCDELEKENQDLKVELENALGLLKQRNSELDSINEALALMKNRLKDQDKKLSESEERYQKVLEDFQQSPRREEENLTTDLKGETPSNSLAEKEPNDNQAENNVTNRDQNKDSKDNLDEANPDREIADILLHHQTCTVCKKEAERILGVDDSQNSKNTEAEESVEEEQSEPYNGSTVIKGNNEEIFTLGSSPEDKIAVSKDEKKLDFMKTPLESKIDTDRLSRETEQPAMGLLTSEQQQEGKSARDSDSDEEALSKVDTSVSKLTSYAGMNLETLTTSNDVNETSIKKNTDGEKEIADILLHHQTCIVCKKEAKRILGTDDEEDKTNSETEGNKEYDENLDRTGPYTVREQVKEASPFSQNEGRSSDAGGQLTEGEEAKPVKLREELSLELQIEGEREADSNTQPGEVISGKQNSSEVEIKMGVQSKKDNNKFKFDHQNEGSLTGNSEGTDSEPVPLPKGDTSLAKQKANTGMNLEESISSTDKSRASIMENKDGEKEIADILLHHQTCTICKKEAERILCTANEDMKNYTESEGTSKDKEISKQDDLLESSVGTVQSPQEPGAESGKNAPSGKITSGKLTSSEVEATLDIQNILSEDQLEKFSKGDDMVNAKQMSQLKDETNDTEFLDTGNLAEVSNTSKGEKKVSLSLDKTAEMEIADTLLHHQTCTICKKEAERILGSVDEEDRNHTETEETIIGNVTLEKDGSLATVTEGDIKDVKTMSGIEEYKGRQISNDEEPTRDGKRVEGKLLGKKEYGISQSKEIVDSTEIPEDSDEKALSESADKDAQSEGFKENLTFELKTEERKENYTHPENNKDNGRDFENDPGKINGQRNEDIHKLSDYNQELAAESTGRTDGTQTSESKDDMSKGTLEQRLDSDIHLEKFITIIEDTDDCLLEDEKENPEREFAAMKLHHQTCSECKEQVERSLHISNKEDKRVIEAQENERSPNKPSIVIDREETIPHNEREINKGKEVRSSIPTSASNRDKVDEIELFNEDGSLTKFIDSITETAEAVAENEERRQSQGSSDEQLAKDDKNGNKQEKENASEQM